jgi:hypothetical protein
MEPPFFLPYSTALSIKAAYSGFLLAARMREGLVVASCGLYLSIVAKSPESQTTVYIIVRQSWKNCMQRKQNGRGGGSESGAAYRAGGFQLIERTCHGMKFKPVNWKVELLIKEKSKGGRELIWRLMGENGVICNG